MAPSGGDWLLNRPKYLRNMPLEAVSVEVTFCFFHEVLSYRQNDSSNILNNIAELVTRKCKLKLESYNT